MDKIIILMCMLNSFVFGADINSLLEKIRNDNDTYMNSLIKNDNDTYMNSLIEQLRNDDENGETLYKILEYAFEILPEPRVEKNFKNKNFGKEFNQAVEIFITAKNDNNILSAEFSCEFSCEEAIVNRVFLLKKNETIQERLKILEPLYSKNENFIRTNQSVVPEETVLEGKKLIIKKINFRYRNPENKPVDLPKKKFFIFEFSVNEKYLIPMSIP